jgi:C1A family cysteine protease
MKNKIFIPIIAVVLVFIMPLASADYSIQPIGTPVIVQPTTPSPLSEIQQINQAIAANGASWTAAENPISSLTPEQRKKLSGISESELAKQKVIWANLTATKKISAVNLPPAFDWRNKDGKNWITSIKDQGQCGSCWAFAAIGDLEAQLKINAKNPDLNPDLSEQQMVSCCPECGSCNGGSSSNAFNYANKTGIVKDACSGYTVSNSACNICYHGDDNAKKIMNWSWIIKEEFKNTLANQGPVVVYFQVYDDFHFYKGGVYRHTWGEAGGGHAMLLVGYNDTGRYWIIKNSWGTYWGEAGYVKVSYDDTCMYGGMVIYDTDADLDGIGDRSDNCINVRNPDQADSDNDKIGDVCDNNDSSAAKEICNNMDDDKNGLIDDGLNNCACTQTITTLQSFGLAAAKTKVQADLQGKFSDNTNEEEKWFHIDYNQPVTVYTYADEFITSEHGLYDSNWNEIFFSSYRYVSSEEFLTEGNYVATAEATSGPWVSGYAETEADYFKKIFSDYNETIFKNQGGGPSSEKCNGIDDDCDGLIDEGCPDSDGDGISDVRDNCLTVYNPDQSDIDKDGIGDLCDPDIDNDKILNANDKCPSIAASTNDGCPGLLLEDFEDISDWDKEAGHLTSFYRSNNAASGSYSMTLSSSAKIGCWTGKVRKTFTPAVSFNNYTTLSFYAKKGNSTYGSYNPSLAISLYDSSGNSYVYGNYYACGGVVINSTLWQKYSLKLPATLSNLSRINIDLYSEGSGSTSPTDFLIDQLELKQTECISNWTSAFTAWSSCSSNDTKTRTKYYYDGNNCSKNNPYQNSTETASCDYCTSTWSCSSYGSCLSNNKKYCTSVNDSKNCYSQTGLNSDKYSGNYSEFSQTCEYCTVNLVNTSWSAWTNISLCYGNNTIDQRRSLVQYDSNNCGKINNQTFYSYQSIACTSCSDECSAGRQCSGNGYQTCGNYDSDSCLEWSSVSSCASNQLCSNGNCQNIACSSNSDCGTNAFSGDLFCSNGNVFQNYRVYSCLNPGTLSSSCTYSDSNQIKQACANGCENGQCITCGSHSSFSCNDNDVYWFDSCSAKEEKKEECGDSGYSGDNYCYNNSVYKDYLTKGCSADACISSTEKIKQQDCAYGCENGACLVQTCTPGWQCKDQTSRYYQYADCSFSAASSCWWGCLNGECIAPSCTDECSSGQKQCSGNGMQVCGNYDNDSCLEWSPINSCASNQLCSNGDCQNIACSSNADCGIDDWIGNLFCSIGNVLQNYRIYSCLNPGTINSSCTYSDSNQTKQTCQNGCENGACKSAPIETGNECPYACCSKTSGYIEKSCSKGYKCLNNKCVPYA